MCSGTLRSITVKKLTFSISAAALAIALSAAAAFAAELPTYEAAGIPVSPVQVRVLGAAHVEQQVTAPESAVTVHQASVLTPRKLKTATVGAAR
jgi:hypothetical protein